MDETELIDMKLDKEVKAKWVEALRSGKFKQGKGKLKYGDNYCCLGVACEIGITSKDFNSELVSLDFLPSSIQDELAKMNDGSKYKWENRKIAGRSFMEIADWIEENL